ncbi:MAG: flagellar basal body-associated protein FliL [Campylobacterota bacterium]|nr:flagellar basal body-associated protein FliL [Campylobacterota bacterium]
MAEEETQESQEESKPEKKSSSLVLIIVIVVLILVILVGVVGFILMSGGDEEESTQNAPVAQEQQQTKKKRPSGGSGDITPFTEIGLMFPMDTFTVNLLSDSGRRYLKAQMNLEIDGEELAAELDTKKAVIRDIIIRLLSSKSLDEISTAKGKDKLKEQITDQLNLRLRDGHINNVYFTEFVIQ